MKKISKTKWKIFSDDKIDDAYASRVTRRFLNELSVEFANISDKLCCKANFLEYPLFAYRERQVHTILSPALYHITDFFIHEAPAERENSRIYDEDDSHGWSDYVCNYNGFAYIIEVKHSHLSYRTLKVDSHTKHIWEHAIEQNQTSNYDADWYSKRSKGVYRLALLVAPIYQSSSKKKPVFKNDINDLTEDVFNQFEKELKLKNSQYYISLWLLPERLRGPYENGDGCFHYYSAVAIVARLARIKVES